MGCWGYKEISSDHGLDRMSGAFLYWVKDNNNILDVDRCLKESAATYKTDSFYKGMEQYCIKKDIIAMSEILYHFINNTVLSELGY